MRPQNCFPLPPKRLKLLPLSTKSKRLGGPDVKDFSVYRRSGFLSQKERGCGKHFKKKHPFPIFQKVKGKEGRNTSSFARFCYYNPTKEMGLILIVVFLVWITTKG